jgi:hypothetical protein
MQIALTKSRISLAVNGNRYTESSSYSNVSITLHRKTFPSPFAIASKSLAKVLIVWGVQRFPFHRTQGKLLSPSHNTAQLHGTKAFSRFYFATHEQIEKFTLSPT